MVLYLTCSKCHFTDIVPIEDGKMWNCPNCLLVDCTNEKNCKCLECNFCRSQKKFEKKVIKKTVKYLIESQREKNDY